jgi:hypothetical protein
MAYRSLRNARKDEFNILTARTRKCLPIHVSDASLERALFVMDSLMSFLEKYSISIDPGSLDKINLLGHKISLAHFGFNS